MQTVADPRADFCVHAAPVVCQWPSHTMIALHHCNRTHTCCWGSGFGDRQYPRTRTMNTDQLV